MNTSKFISGVMYCINSANDVSSFSSAGDKINQPLFDAGYEGITISELYEKFGVDDIELCCVGYLVNEYGSEYGSFYCKEICDKYGFEIPEETDIYDQVSIYETIEEAIKDYSIVKEGIYWSEAFAAFMAERKIAV